MDSDYIRLFDASVKLEVALWTEVERAVVDAVGIKLGSVLALRAIAAQGDEARVQDLALSLGITIGAVSKIIDRLQSAGLVTRTPHATDGRSSVIGRTSAGTAAMVAALDAMHDSVLAQVRPLLGEAEVRDMAVRMERLVPTAPSSTSCGA